MTKLKSAPPSTTSGAELARLRRGASAFQAYDDGHDIVRACAARSKRAAGFGMRPRYAAFWLAISSSVACGKAATPAPPAVAPPPPPSAQEQACAQGFKLSPDTLAHCAAQHRGACYPS